jgi:CDP-diacylglycerol--glycerol-3-phosphate 3-phosphatidyltransferase
MSYSTLTPEETPEEPNGRARSTVIQFPQPESRRKAIVSSEADGKPGDFSNDLTAAPTGTDTPREDVSLGSTPDSSSGSGEDASGQGESGPLLDASGLPVEKFWNLPNTVTMLRVGVIPILVFLPWTQGVQGSKFMAYAFIIAALTDWLDGYLARRNDGKHITRIGKLLDPLADKMIVSTALVMLLAIGRIPLWASAMVVVIIGRELAVTGLRGIASTHGMVVAAAGPGKLKTVAQTSAIAALLFHYETWGLPAHNIGMTLLAIATALTLWSGYLYFAEYFGGTRQSPKSQEQN